MAIAIETSASYNLVTGTATHTKSITLGSVSNGLLYVHVLDWANISSITWNGVALTEIAKNDDGGYESGHYYLKDPASGTHDLVVTLTGSNYCAFEAIHLSGVDQTTPVNQHGTDGYSNDWTDRGTSLTTTEDGCGVFTCAYMDNGAIVAGDANSTMVVQNSGNTSGIARSATFPQASAGSILVTTDGATNSWCRSFSVAFNPVLSQTYEKAITATAVASVAITDIANFLKSLTVTALASISLIKQAQKTITTTAQASVSQIKQLYKEFEVTAIGEAIISASRVFLQELVATASAIAQITKQEVTLVTLEVTAQATASVSMIKSFVRTITATAQATASIVTGYTLSKILEVTASATVSIEKGLVLSKELVVTAVGIATTTIQKAVSVSLSVVASAIARLTRDFGYTDKYPRNEVDYEDKYPTNSEY